MQNKHPQKSRSKKASRVYQLRSRNLQSVEDNHKRDLELGTYAQASSVSEIDLPVCNLDTAVTSLTQSFSFDQDIELTAKPESHLYKTVDNLTSVFGVYESEYTLTEDTRHFSVTEESSKHVATQTFGISELPSDSKTGREGMEGCQDEVNSKKLGKTSLYTCKTNLHSAIGARDLSKKFIPATDNVANYVQCETLEVKNCKGDKLKRPQYQVSGFMEDHAEFSTDWRETVEKQGGHYTSSVLESTVDGSVIKGARRSYGSRVTPADLDNFIDMAIQIGSVEKDPLIALDEWGLKSEQHKYKCSACEVVSKTRSDIEQHIAEAQRDHREAVVIVLIGPEARGRSCPVCNVRLQRTQLFKHIRDSHSTFFPLRCGYCVFMGQDHNQLRHHIRKKHGTTKYRIIDISRILSENNESGEKSFVNEEDHSDDESQEEPSQEIMQCPICGKVLKTLRNLKKHVVQHSRQKEQCVLCSFTTSFPTQIRSHFRRRHPTHSPQWEKVMLNKGGNDGLVEDITPYLQLITSKYGVRQQKKEKKWMRQYRCPHCDYTCSFNSSYNRHLRLHNGVKPFKCGYCDFHGREAYVVKKHCLKVHKGKKPVIEGDKTFKAPYRYDSRTRKEKCDWTCSLGDEESKSTVITSNHSSVQSPTFCNKDTLTKHVVKKAQLDVADEKLAFANASASFEKNIECLTFKTVDNMTECEIENKESNYQEQTKSKNIENILENFTSSAIVSTGGIETLNSQSNNGDSQATLGYEFLKDERINLKSVGTQLEIQPVKVKTFKVKHSLQNKPLKMNEGCVDRKKISNISPQPENINRTLSRSENNFAFENCEQSICSISSVLLESDDSDNTVVIELCSADDDGISLREVSTVRRLEEEKQKSLGLVSIDPSIRSADDTHQPKLLTISCNKVQPITHDDNTYTESDKISEAETMKKPSGSSVCMETLVTEGRESHGLENTLHTHIAFLTDSLVQHLSSPISATPGVMTRDLLGLDYSNSDYFSSEKVRLMMKKKSGGKVKCTVCGVTTTYRAFYKHAKKHFHMKPFKCGYCSYRSIEKSKIRVHNTFCHPSRPCVILKLSPEMAGVNTEKGHETLAQPSQLNRENLTDREKVDSSIDNACRRRLPPTSSSPESSITEEEKFNRIGRSQSFLSTSTKSANVSSGPSTFQCPICYKQLQIHTPSIRRHLYSHYGYKPYKCGYCNFTAIGQNEIRAHHVTHGFTTSPKVESSGVTMPSGLAPYINELLSQQRGNRKPQKKKGQLDHVEEAAEMDGGNQHDPSDLMWTEMDTSKEELTTIYFNPQESSQRAFTPEEQQECLQDLTVSDSHLTEPLESVDLSSEAAYAVQVLESGQNPGSSNSPTPQLNLTTEQTPYSQLNSDQVCVVYLID